MELVPCCLSSMEQQAYGIANHKTSDFTIDSGVDNFSKIFGRKNFVGYYVGLKG